MSLKEEFIKYGKVADCPIIDTHAHWGKMYGATLPAESLEYSKKLFEDSNVQKLVIATHSSLQDPNTGNADNIKIIRSYPEKFKGYFSVNPNYMNLVERDLKEWDKYLDVWVGFKVLADYHGVKISDDRFTPIYEFANARKLPILFHTWGDSGFDGSKEIEKVLKKYSDLIFIAGHAIHDEWEVSKQFTFDYPNYYFDTVALPDERNVIEDYFSDPRSVDKMFFGTDYPWFSYHYYIGAMLDTGLDDESLRKVFYGNAKRIFNF